MSELLNILHPGFIIKTKLINSDAWRYDIINSLYNDTLIISNICSECPTEGAEVIFKASSTEAEYIVNSSITAIDNEEIPIYKIKIIDFIKYLNYRKEERFICKIGANIKPSKDKIGTFSAIDNISISGAHVESMLDVELSEMVKIDIIYSGEYDTIKLNAKIIRKDKVNGKNLYGLIFMDNSSVEINQFKDTVIQNLEKLKNDLYDSWQKKFVKNTPTENSGLKILIVDDIKFTRSNIKSVLETKNWFSCFEEASNGTEAIDKIQLIKPDIVTLDLSMPGIDGISTIKSLSGFFPLNKIIIISSDINDVSKKLLIDLGIVYFLSKPFNEDEIFNIIKNIFPEVEIC